MALNGIAKIMAAKFILIVVKTVVDNKTTNITRVVFVKKKKKSEIFPVDLVI